MSPIKEKLFLETNTQFLRIFGTDRERRLIATRLNGNILLSSYFVFKEFQVLLIVTLIDFYFFIKQYNNIKEACREFINEYSFSRKYKTLFIAIADDLKNYNNPMKAIAQIELLINLSIKSFYKDISFMIDIAKCPISKVKFSPGFENVIAYYHKIQCSPTCCTVYFFKTKKTSLEKAIEKERTVNLTKVPGDKKKEFNKLVMIYNKILQDFRYSQQYKNALGDTIIGLECPKSAKLITYDNIFIALGQVFGINFEILKHPPKTVKSFKLLKN